MDIKELAKAAGFRVFADKIVAADEGSSGLATESVARLIALVQKQEAQACWDAINKWIKPGELQGNGLDDHAQRNGMILASNQVMERIMRSNAELRGASQLAGAASRSNAELGEEG
jgi:hypothetical protein